MPPNFSPPSSDQLTRVTGTISKLTVLVDNAHFSLKRFDPVYYHAPTSPTAKSRTYYPQLVGTMVVFSIPAFAQMLMPLWNGVAGEWGGADGRYRLST